MHNQELLQHECLDRSFLIMETFATFLLDHPYIQEDEELYKLAEEAHAKLYKLYTSLSE